MFKSTRPNHLVIIILWVIAIFIAVVKLPGMTNLITNLNNEAKSPSQIANSRQLINANRLQHQWGRRLSDTSSTDIVYHQPRGSITAKQQALINHRIEHLQKHSNQYGIQKITDLNSNRDGTDELRSKDNSTEIVQLRVNSHYQRANANVWADEVKDITKVPALSNSITSPRLLKAASTRSTIHKTVIITVISLLIASIVMGLIFKSIIIPIISLVSLLVTDLITLSLSGNLASWTGYNEFTPLAILLVILIMGSIMTYFIYQAIIPELPKHRDANNAVQSGLDKVKRPIELSGIILTLAFGAAVLIPENNVKSIAALGIAFAVLTLAELTLTPTFVSWLGSSILWPSHRYTLPEGHHLWNRLTRLSLWQPLIGIIAVIYFVVPFAYSYRNSFEYSQANNVANHNQAVLGKNALNAHFTEGKSTPVTIYLKNPQKFNHEKTLKPLDDLTTKLHSMPGVNSVYSLTQPSSMPINKYYVDHQLSTVNDSLNQNQNQLYKAGQALSRGNKKLGKQRLNKIIQGLTRLKNVKGQIPQTNLTSPIKQASSGQKASITSKINGYANQLQSLNSKLNQLSSGLSDVSTLSSDAKDYQSQINTVHGKITSATKQLKKVNDQLNDIYSYLSSLQRSSASHQYFITPDQIQDTDFQQSLINFTSQNERITKIQVVFNQSPSTRYNQARLKNLQNEIKTQLQGTALSQAKIALSGVPVQQASIQRNFKSGVIKMLLISFGIILIGLILISRSIFNPLFWLLSFALSGLASLQITELLIRFTADQAQFNWQTMLSVAAVLAGVSVIELVPLGLSYRHRNVGMIEWLHEALTSFGQAISAILVIITMTAVSLFTGMNYQFVQISLVIIFTVIIFNWVLPLLASAFGKYLKTLPHSRL